MPPRKRQNEREPDDGLLMSIAVRLRGVMGELQTRNDVVLVGRYEEDRAACEAAIRKAQAELDEAGEGAVPEENEFELAWAWQKLSLAYNRLADVEARVRLARRRAELDAAAKAHQKPAV